MVTQYFWPEPFRINDLVENLVSRGHQVTVLTGYPNYPEGQIYPPFKASPDDFDEYARAKVVRVPILPRGKGNLRLALNYLSFVLSGLLFGTWRLRGQPYDAIFVFQTSPITAALPAIWFRRLKRAPMLMWVLDLWPESLSAVGVLKSPHLLAWVGHLVSFIYQHCDRILIQSRAFFPNIARYTGNISKVRYFPSWSEPIFHIPLEDVPLAPEMVPFKNTFNVMFTGNIGEAQDFPTILKAVEILKEHGDIRWLIVGDGRAASFLKTQIEERKLQSRIILLGRHPLERVPSFMRGAQALLVTLRREPIFSLTVPGKLQTYLATGLPLIGMLDGEGAQIILDSGAGFACPAGDGVALAQCIRNLADLRREVRASMGRQGRKYCITHFDRESLISDLEAWTEELVVTNVVIPSRGRTHP
ncbi:glycosyltransferase family 4 protein [Geothrix sp. 21YS21S-4]|uniref:glycosyltransferase family 4 protein n=1 Tax=Geothrix sp. 21YS21S-4 TaxID=3068889 RepID=UPI0027B9D09C|nr:glycosyltransferase family 4 protein [Geothrix sp. 21YS21S-4]